MPWVKKKGLYLPDPTSYAESINAFEDDFTTSGVLYISLGFKITRKGGGGNDVFNPVYKMSGYAGYKIEFTTARDADYCNYFRMRYYWGTGSSTQSTNVVSGSQGGPQIIEVFHKLGQTQTVVLNGASKAAQSPYNYADPYQEALTKLRLNPHPDSTQAIWIDHLVIGNQIPPWANQTRLNDGTACAIKPDYWADAHLLWWDAVPLGVNLHWAMLEGLIDPSQFLHFYTFQELDENGNIPDYGSNPQPLALYGNAQLAEAFEVEPQFNPIVVYDVHALRLEAKVKPFKMRAKLRRGE